MIRTHFLISQSCRDRPLLICILILVVSGAEGSQGTLTSCGINDDIVIDNVELSPPVPRPSRQLNVSILGHISDFSHHGIEAAGLRVVADIFFCRRINDCMSVFQHEGSFCAITNRKGDACAHMKPGENFIISSTSQLPLLIMRGTYNLKLQILAQKKSDEPSFTVGCCWFSGVSVVAFRFINILRDYRDAFVAFVVAATSSKALGVFFPTISGGLLPQISGFLFMGILVGPYAANLVSHLHMVLIGDVINRVSLAFIAGAAGAEIFLPELRNLLAPITLQVLLICIATVLFCTIGLMALSHLSVISVPFISEQPTSASRWAVSLLCGVLMTARSPASAIGVISELGCNRLQIAKIAIGVTVLGDVVVLVLFALCMKLVRQTTLGDTFEFGVACDVCFEIGASLCLGLLAGQLLRFVLPTCKPNEPNAYSVACGEAGTNQQICLALRGLLLLAILYLTFLVAEDASEWTGGRRLEPLLSCITAACLCGHDETRRGQLQASLSFWTPHVLLPFFTLAGASLQLPNLWEMLSAAVALVLLRMLGVACGSAAAGIFSAKSFPELHITDTAIRCTWLTLLAQAGVTLGLVLEVQAAFPTWSKNFGTLVIGVVVVNQLLGPVLCRIGIKLVANAECTSAGIKKDNNNYLLVDDTNSIASETKLDDGINAVNSPLTSSCLGSSYTMLAATSRGRLKSDNMILPLVRRHSDPSVHMLAFPNEQPALSFLGCSYTNLLTNTGLANGYGRALTLLPQPVLAPSSPSSASSSETNKASHVEFSCAKSEDMVHSQAVYCSSNTANHKRYNSDPSELLKSDMPNKPPAFSGTSLCPEPFCITVMADDMPLRNLDGEESAFTFREKSMAPL